VHYLNTENVDESLINMAKSAQDKLTVPPNKPDLSKLAKTLKTKKEFNKDIKKTESSETITKVYRGVEYQVQKQL
jgi:cbb3-type cytochrome oxidase cytochrome c subunit